MKKIAAVLSVSLVAVLAFGAEPTTADLEKQKAALEKQVAALRVKLAVIEKELKKRGRIKPLPAYWIKENASEFRGDEYAIVSKLKFAPPRIGKPRSPAWHNSVSLPVRSPARIAGPDLPVSLELRCLYTREGGGDVVFQFEHPSPIPKEGTMQIFVHTFGIVVALRKHRMDPAPPRNAYIAVRIKKALVYEALWKSERPSRKKGAVPWWRDGSILVPGESFRMLPRTNTIVSPARPLDRK